MCLSKGRRSERKEERGGMSWEEMRLLREILREDRKARGAPEDWKPTVC